MSYCKFCIYTHPVNSKFTIWQHHYFFLHCSTHSGVLGIWNPPLNLTKYKKNIIKRNKRRKEKRRGTVVYNLYICLIFMLIHVYRMNNHIMICFLQNFTFTLYLLIHLRPFKKNLDPRLAPPIHTSKLY